MPTVAVDKEDFFKSIGRSDMTIEEFDELCFDFGVELDDITSEKEMAKKQADSESEAIQNLSDRLILKIDVSANRYDLLCHEGLARALRIFLGKEKPPKFVVEDAKIKLMVKSSTARIRPYVVAAVLRNVTFTQKSYESFIELQEKLHQGLCRRRKKVAIGTHDLDTLQAPFFYEALAPADISFVPLNQTNKMNGIQVMSFYEQDKRLSKFLPLIRDSDVYPVIYDASGKVLSLPPIINGDHSKIKLHTKNVFIECTGLEEAKASMVLNMMVTMFSEYCSKKFHVEAVNVTYENENHEICHVYPKLEPKSMQASISYINSCVGAGKYLEFDQISSLLEKMGLHVEKTENMDIINVLIPAYRTDILHQCDIMEDVAVSFGINKIPRAVPQTNTVAKAFDLNKLSDMLRRELAFSGWTEVLPLTLCSHDENYKFLRKDDPKNEAVVLSNPQTSEYQLVRTSLIPGLLKTYASNKKSPLPLKIFEIGDIVLQDISSDRRARNQRRICALFSSKTSGLESIHGLLDRIMAMLGISFGPSFWQYQIRPSSLPTYFPGRQAQVEFRGNLIGAFGILHPDCLNHFDLNYPCSILEINIEPFL